MGNAMKCWHCQTELIWGGDHSIGHEEEEYSMVTNLSCPHCGSYVEVYLPKDDNDDDEIETGNY